MPRYRSCSPAVGSDSWIGGEPGKRGAGGKGGGGVDRFGREAYMGTSHKKPPHRKTLQ